VSVVQNQAGHIKQMTVEAKYLQRSHCAVNSVKHSLAKVIIILNQRCAEKKVDIVKQERLYGRVINRYGPLS
jgi:hypothetical protein